MCSNVSRCHGWQCQAYQMLLAVLGLGWMQATMTLVAIAWCNDSLGCRWKARWQQGQGALSATLRRKVGDRAGFRVFYPFTPPLLCYDHVVYFYLKYPFTRLFLPGVLILFLATTGSLPLEFFIEPVYPGFLVTLNQTTRWRLSYLLTQMSMDFQVHKMMKNITCQIFSK